MSEAMGAFFASITLLALLVGPPAHAVPIVHDRADPTELVDTVAGRTGLPRDQLRPVAMDELRDAPPEVLGEAVLRRCAGSPTTATGLRTSLARAEAAWSDNDALGAFDQLDLAVSEMGCLGELIEPSVAARVFQLRGALEAQRDQPLAASSEFRTALGFDPDLTWVTRYPGVAAPMFEAERESPRPHAIVVLPSGTTSGPWIDGQALSAQGGRIAVSPGLHLVQHATPRGIRSAWLMVTGDAHLVLPESYREPILDAVLDPDRALEVAALLCAALPDFSAAYISHAEGLWLVTEGSEGPELAVVVEPPPPPPVEEEAGRRGRKERKE